MSSGKQLVGKKGEKIAASFLQKKGYNIIRRNFRSGRSEIDLICKFEDKLIFVEVKTRNSTKYGYPEESVDQHKIEMILKGAEDYIFDENWKGKIRFDIIAIQLYPTIEIFHFTDAFY